MQKLETISLEIEGAVPFGAWDVDDITEYSCADIIPFHTISIVLQVTL